MAALSLALLAHSAWFTATCVPVRCDPDKTHYCWSWLLSWFD